MVSSVPRRSVLRAEFRPESFHRILHILTANSLEWLHGAKNPEIRIKAVALKETCEIIFSDNGPGIPAELATQVFEPLYSGREGGRGMGLTIARNILTLHSGNIEVIVDGRRRGANIRIRLPRKRSRATVHLS
jgi:C4-dicarboxylate-specific signal transduction histidine kinase